MSFEQYDRVDDEIELKTLFLMLWDFKGFILRVTLLFGVIALLFSGISYVLANPVITHEAVSTVGIGVDNSVPRQKQAYLSVLSSEASINAAITNLELTHDFSYEDVIIEEVEDTNSIKVLVHYENANDALVITDAIVNQSILVANDVLTGVRVTAREMAALTGNTTSSKELPNVVLNTVIALVLGAMISVFMVFFMEYLLGKVKTKEDIEKSVQIEVLATLSNTVEKKKQGWWPWKN